VKFDVLTELKINIVIFPLLTPYILLDGYHFGRYRSRNFDNYPWNYMTSEHKFLYLREGVEQVLSGLEQGKVTCFLNVLTWFSREKLPVPTESVVWPVACLMTEECAIRCVKEGASLSVSDVDPYVVITKLLDSISGNTPVGN
jgi:hypothetical protein